MTSEYAKTDPRMILLDVYSEIIDCREELKLMRKDLAEVRIEFNAMLQTANDFQRVMLQIQREIPSLVGNAAMNAFEQELIKAQERHSKMQKRSWWRRLINN